MSLIVLSTGRVPGQPGLARPSAPQDHDPENDTPRTPDSDTPRPAQHITPRLICQTRERRKLILAAHSPNPEPTDTHLTQHLLNPPSSAPAIRPKRPSRDSHASLSPCDITGRPRDNRIRGFRPDRASEGTPAYLELPATSQAPDPNLAATPQARTQPKAAPVCPDSTATFHARDAPLAPRRQVSYEPFEPLRDQVRRDGISPFTSVVNKHEYMVCPLAVGLGGQQCLLPRSRKASRSED